MGIAENLQRIRHARGMSQAGLAGEIGVRQNTIAAIEAGTTKKSKYLPDIARVLQVSLTELDPNQRFTETRVIPGGALVGPLDLALYATVEGDEGVVVMSRDPVDEIRRPAPLAAVKGAYGVIVAGESMVPVLRPGDVALVHPHLPPRPEDTCIFIAEKDGEFVATIKEYLGQTKDTWKVKRYKPKETDFVLKKKDWPRCDVVVGKYARR
jgi:transcriptional regulator with XRE-family HTH domain